MFRRRRYYGGIRRSKKRYSNETTSIAISQSVLNSTFPVFEGNLGYTLVPNVTTQGTRKVKNMTISLSAVGCTEPLLCAIVYCPGGLRPSTLTPGDTTTGSGSVLYEPNQNIIMQFVLNPSKNDTFVNTNVQTFRTRLARNLDSNDYIALICRPAIGLSAATNVKVCGTFNYSIAY